MAQGMGFALMEEFIEKQGIPETTSLKTYMVPTAKDVPDIRPIIMESHSGMGPFGAKGIGEAAMIAMQPAIANAVYDAVGVWIRDLPLTPEKVLKALQEKGEEEKAYERLHRREKK